MEDKIIRIINEMAEVLNIDINKELKLNDKF